MPIMQTTPTMQPVTTKMTIMTKTTITRLPGQFHHLLVNVPRFHPFIQIGPSRLQCCRAVSASASVDGTRASGVGEDSMEDREDEAEYQNRDAGGDGDRNGEDAEETLAHCP